MRVEECKKLCGVGKYLLYNRLPDKAIYHSPHLYKSTHFPNADGKSKKHSKDPRNCPIVLFFDSTHFVLISFLLRDPIMVLPISNSQRSIDDLSKMLGVTKNTNAIHKTFRRVVHDYIFKIVNVVAAKQKEEIEAKFPDNSGAELKITKPGSDKKKKLPEVVVNFYNNNRIPEEERMKELLKRNVVVTLSKRKMSKYPISLIITKITP